jgi:ATP-binding cassette, subfamily B, bacterial
LIGPPLTGLIKTPGIAPGVFLIPKTYMQTNAQALASWQALITALWPYLRPRQRMAAIVLALSLLAPVAASGFLWLFARLVDEVFVAQNLALLPGFLLAYLALGCLRFAIDWLDRRLDAQVHEACAQDLRVSLYRHVLQLSPGSLGNIGPGDVLERLGSDADRAITLIFRGPVGLLGKIARVLCYGTMLLVMSGKLTLMALAVAPFLVWVVARRSARLRSAATQAREHSAAWKSMAQERLLASELVQAFYSHDAEAKALAASADRARAAEVQTVRHEAALSVWVEAVTLLGALAVIAMAAREVAAGLLSVGGVLAFLGAIGSLYDPIRGISQSAGRFQRAGVSARRVLALLHTPSQVHDRGPAASAAPLRARGAIALEQVSFAYPAGDAVLHNISLRIEPGECVAIVGASGSGKSSLLRLLLRLYEPSSGRITLDGLGLPDWPLAQLRAQMSVVLQEPHVLSASVAQTIAYGAPTASPQAIQSAARLAGADDFVQALPMGYHEPIGLRGERLSGGQRQRLALARALLRPAPVLLLDEATSAMDGTTETQVQQALSTLRGQRTLVVVGHRLATVRGADRMVVLEQGQIVEMGSPEQLLRVGTRCHALFASQLADASNNVVALNEHRLWHAAR